MMLRTKSGAYLVLGAFCELNNAAQTQKWIKTSFITNFLGNHYGSGSKFHRFCPIYVKNQPKIQKTAIYYCFFPQKKNNNIFKNKNI